MRLQDKSHIVLIIPRGEAVRNFLYSDTIKILSENARITVLTVVDDMRFIQHFEKYTDKIIKLENPQERYFVKILRLLIHEAHFKWLWSEVAKNVWEIRDENANTLVKKIKARLIKLLVLPLANRAVLRLLTKLDQYFSWKFRNDDYFVDLFRELKPDLIFNGSHIHGVAGELPVKIAHKMGIKTAGFIFSWDNLTSRSRIFVPYDYYFVWHENMKTQLLEIYPEIQPKRVKITGTPQFDFHFKEEFEWTKEQLCEKIGVDSERPIVLYTAGIDRHFPEEHRTVQYISEILGKIDINPKPQMVVRTYVKGTSKEMQSFVQNGLPHTTFIDTDWDEKFYTPSYDDLFVYTNLIRYCVLGINAASTVSLELMMFDKPVINLGFDPPGGKITNAFRWIRHLKFDHYKPVVESGAVLTAMKPEDLSDMILHSIRNPKSLAKERQKFLSEFFKPNLNGIAGAKVAEELLNLMAQKNG